MAAMEPDVLQRVTPNTPSTGEHYASDRPGLSAPAPAGEAALGVGPRSAVQTPTRIHRPGSALARTIVKQAVSNVAHAGSGLSAMHPRHAGAERLEDPCGGCFVCLHVKRPGCGRLRRHKRETFFQWLIDSSDGTSFLSFCVKSPDNGRTHR